MQRRFWTAVRWHRLAACAAAFGLAVCSTASANEGGFGAFGPESPRMREQLWIFPGADPEVPLRGTVFQPPAIEPPVTLALSGESGAMAKPQQRRPLVIINHGTDESTREAVAMPVFYWLSRWFVERGFVVAIPQRRGHGATGGELAEARDTCISPRHQQAGEIAAADIEAVLRFMRDQPFVDPDHILLAGISTGGWGSLAAASHNLPGLTGVINFAGGRGGHAMGHKGSVCGSEQLVAAAAQFGKTARVPTLWLYSGNDSYFPPPLARAMADAWTGAGGQADFVLLPDYGTEGHSLAEDRAGWQLWTKPLMHFMAERARPPTGGTGSISAELR